MFKKHIINVVSITCFRERVQALFINRIYWTCKIRFRRACWPPAPPTSSNLPGATALSLCAFSSPHAGSDRSFRHCCLHHRSQRVSWVAPRLNSFQGGEIQESGNGVCVSHHYRSRRHSDWLSEPAHASTLSRHSVSHSLLHQGDWAWDVH